jgi:hypothetical protein
MRNLLKSKIELVNTKLSEITGTDQTMMAEIIVDLNDIVAVREHAPDNESEINPNTCAIYLNNGDYFCLFTPYSEVVRRLGW